MHLILADECDIHADAVAYVAAKLGAQVQLRPSFSSRGLNESSVYFEGGAPATCIGGVTAFKSIWNRRPQRIAPPHPVAEEDAAFVVQQWRDFTNGIVDLSTTSSRAFWINSHFAAVAAENKMYQLSVASKLGFSIPRTLMSAEPGAIRKFLRSSNRSVFKAFSPFVWTDRSSGNVRVTETLEISLDKVDLDSSIRVAPGIYQELIKKKHEVRAVVIGEKLFAMEVTADDGVDWRREVYAPGARISARSLPHSLEARIHRLMRKMGLVYGCLDLAVDENGDVYFLEINQGGQFLYMESKLPDLPLLAAFTSMLLQCRTDYSVCVDRKSASFANYEASERYEQLKEKVRAKPMIESAYMSFVE